MIILFLLLLFSALLGMQPPLDPYDLFMRSESESEETWNPMGKYQILKNKPQKQQKKVKLKKRKNNFWEQILYMAASVFSCGKFIMKKNLPQITQKI